LNVGLQLGHYRIVEKIDAGGMGEVYRARDERLARDVAIKVLPQETLTDQSARKHLHREARILSRLNHPNIATVHDFDTQQGVDFLVMEYIQGITLSEKVAGRPLPEKEILRLGVQLAEGLAAAHSHGIVHRDLKPGNLRIASDGQLKILDFGLAKLRLPPTSSAETETFSDETQAMAGTLPYMAPEQLLGQDVDARTDIHGAGAVLYEMATGQRPFAEVKRSHLIAAILRMPPQLPSSFDSRVSPELERIIGKCLEKEPENRYQSSKELAIDLRRLLMPNTAKVTEATTAEKKLWKVLIPGAVILVAAAVAAAFYFHLSQSKVRLTGKDTIVLADFDNKTGDAVFDDTLKTGLSLSLRQSPFLNVLSDERVVQTLQLMTRPIDTKLTPDVARELCQRTGSQAYIAGSIGGLGSAYVLGLRVVNCQNGDMLAQEQVTAASKEQVLAALGEAAEKLRRQLGESLATLQKFDVPLEQNTTPSLEALKIYVIASDTWNAKGSAEAIPLFRRAIEIDPNFASAYLRLGVCYGNVGQGPEERTFLTKAYSLRDRVSEWEKFRITAAYYLFATGEWEKAKQTLGLWMQSYPQDIDPHFHLAYIFASLGELNEAVAEYEKVLRAEPNSSGAHLNLGACFLALDRFDDAAATFDQARSRNFDGGALHQLTYYLAFLRNDATIMEQQLAWSAGRPGDEDVLLSTQSDTEAFYGHLAAARVYSRKAVDSAIRAESRDQAARWVVNGALREAEFGNATAARQGVRAAQALSSETAALLAAFSLARLGDRARGQALMRQFEKSSPSNTVLRVYWLPTLKAAIALPKNPTQALEFLEIVTPYELGNHEDEGPPLYAPYLRGQAYLALGNGSAAAAEFERILNHRGKALNSFTGALSRLGVARAYALQRDNEKARAAYQNFLKLWKDADPEIPVLKQARAEYTKLQ
jgi:serine/threonine protein kinase/tetratricopeptide (TPR) repeat protein